MKKRKAPLFLLLIHDSISKKEHRNFYQNLSKQQWKNVEQGKGILQLFTALSFVFFVSIVNISCSDDNHKEIEQPSIDIISYSPKSMDIVELQYKPIGQMPGTIDFDKASIYFGDRLSMFQPEKIIFKNDSVSIIKSGGLIQKYKTEWSKNSLYLYNDVAATWEYCASKEGETTLILNAGFFWVKDNNRNGALSVIGQKYSLLSYSDLVTYLGGNNATLNNQIAWLKVQYTFELIPEVEF